MHLITVCIIVLSCVIPLLVLDGALAFVLNVFFGLPLLLERKVDEEAQWTGN